MKSERIYIKDFIIADEIDAVMQLKSVMKQKEEIFLLLQDKTGVIFGQVNSGVDVSSIEEKKDVPVKVHGIVKPGRNGKTALSIKDIALANPNEVKSSELSDGLSREKIEEYSQLILSLKSHVKHPGFTNFLNVLLSNENIQKLSCMPATTGLHGKYKGGALACTAVVSELVKQNGIAYVKHYNALHQGNINWSLLLAASLSHCMGILMFITSEEPFEKTRIGIDRGYLSCLQSVVERTALKSGLNEEDLSSLLNVLSSACAMKTEVKATSKEGIILRQAIRMYSELDMLDYEVNETELSEEDEGRGYFYDKYLRRYLTH